MRKRTWIFIIAIGTIIAVAIWLRNKGETTTDANSPNYTYTSTFTPAELISLANNYSVDNLADYCMDKGLEGIIQKDQSIKDGRKYTLYSYFIMQPYHSPSSDVYGNLRFTSECILFTDTADIFTYMVDNQSTYDTLISYLQKHKAQRLPLENRFYEFKYNIHYLLNGCIFIDRKRIYSEKYAFSIISKANLDKVNSEIKLIRVDTLIK